MTTVTLLGGPYDGVQVELTNLPPRIVAGDIHLYRRLDDIDTGEFLGAYGIVGPSENELKWVGTEEHIKVLEMRLLALKDGMSITWHGRLAVRLSDLWFKWRKRARS